MGDFTAKGGRIGMLEFVGIALSRLQLKRALPWYRHQPTVHEMVSNRSSWAESRTDPRDSNVQLFDSKRKALQAKENEVERAHKYMRL